VRAPGSQGPGRGDWRCLEGAPRGPAKGTPPSALRGPGSAATSQLLSATRVAGKGSLDSKSPLHCTAGLSLPVYEMGTARLACGVLERKGKGLSFREEGVVTEAGTGFEAEGLQDSGICWGLWVCPLGRDRGQDLLLSVFTWGKKSLEGCWGEERVAAPNPAPCTAKKKTDLATWVAGPPQPPLPASWGCEADVLLRATQRRSAWGKVLCSHSTGEVTEA
jgi:hypothetical protein